MKHVSDSITTYAKWLIGVCVVFFVWSVFVDLGWNGFAVPVFGLRHMSFYSACGATLLWWLFLVSVVGIKEMSD